MRDYLMLVYLKVASPQYTSRRTRDTFFFLVYCGTSCAVAAAVGIDVPQFESFYTVPFKSRLNYKLFMVCCYNCNYLMSGRICTSNRKNSWNIIFNILQLKKKKKKCLPLSFKSLCKIWICLRVIHMTESRWPNEYDRNRWTRTKIDNNER